MLLQELQAKLEEALSETEIEHAILTIIDEIEIARFYEQLEIELGVYAGEMA